MARISRCDDESPLMSMKYVMVAAALLCSACGSSPTAPSAPPAQQPPTQPTTITITGHVTATNGGQPLRGVTAAISGVTAATDGSGSFSASMPPQASVGLALTGSSIVPRMIRVAAANTRTVTADAIMLGSGFDLTFYRAMVRNGFEQPGVLQPLRRWTKTPNI